MKNLLILGACLLITTTGNAATCSDTGYYCPADGRYQRVQYIEMNGSQYLDTGIPLNSKYDMEMTWQNTKFVHDRWVTGIYTAFGKPAVYMTGTWSGSDNNVSIAMYNIVESGVSPYQAIIDFDTNIHTTYCYKSKGIWIDNESNLQPANYEMELPSNKNFLVGCRIQGNSPGHCWTGRVYSFIFKDNYQIMAELVPVYDTQSEQYGMYDTVLGTFRGNLGSGSFIGGDFTNEAFPCRNAPINAHYTGSGTDNNCPWECDTGYVRTSVNTCAAPCPVLQQLNISTKTLNTYAERQTQPALVLQYKNKMCYINAVPGHGSGTLNLKRGNDIFHLVN